VSVGTLGEDTVRAKFDAVDDRGVTGTSLHGGGKGRFHRDVRHRHRSRKEDTGLRVYSLSGPRTGLGCHGPPQWSAEVSVHTCS